MGFFGRGKSDRKDYGNRGNKEMFTATCSSCNDSCQVPFKPNGSKPVFCSDCFDNKGESGNRRDSRGGGGGGYGNKRGGDRRRDGGERRHNREMHAANCDECGNNCQVPFRPSRGKPIFCSDCFEKNGNGGNNRAGGRNFESKGPNLKKELDQINEKLDMLLEAMTEEYDEA